MDDSGPTREDMAIIFFSSLFVLLLITKLALWLFGTTGFWYGG